MLTEDDSALRGLVAYKPELKRTFNKNSDKANA